MKNQNFVVEVINDEDKRQYIIRDLQGRVIKVCPTPDDLATFFANVEFKA